MTSAPAGEFPENDDFLLRLAIAESQAEAGMAAGAQVPAAIGRNPQSQGPLVAAVLTNIDSKLQAALHALLVGSFEYQRPAEALEGETFYNGMVVILTDQLQELHGDQRLQEILWVGERETRVHHVVCMALHPFSMAAPIWRSSAGEQSMADHTHVASLLHSLVDAKRAAE